MLHFLEDFSVLSQGCSLMVFCVGQLLMHKGCLGCSFCGAGIFPKPARSSNGTWISNLKHLQNLSTSNIGPIWKLPTLILVPVLYPFSLTTFVSHLYHTVEAAFRRLIYKGSRDDPQFPPWCEAYSSSQACLKNLLCKVIFNKSRRCAKHLVSPPPWSVMVNSCLSVVGLGALMTTCIIFLGGSSSKYSAILHVTRSSPSPRSEGSNLFLSSSGITFFQSAREYASTPWNQLGFSTTMAFFYNLLRVDFNGEKHGGPRKPNRSKALC